MSPIGQFAYQQTNRDYVILTYRLCTDQVSLLEERDSTIGKDSRANGGEATDTTNVISFTQRRIGALLHGPSDVSDPSEIGRDSLDSDVTTDPSE